MDYQYLSIHRDGPIATVTITREQALNALSSSVLSELLAAQAEVEADADGRVVILTGAGPKAFVAGADIAEMKDMSPGEAAALSELGGAVCRGIEHSAKPWIAAVNGFALGGGLELAMACDFIFAAESANVGQPEVKLGVIPGFGGTQRLLRRVGVAKAKHLIFSGDLIPAAEALRIGLVDAVFPGGEVMAAAVRTAQTIAKNGPLAVAEAKRVIHLGQSLPLDGALALESRAFGNLFATADQREGMAAFSAKRAANFTYS